VPPDRLAAVRAGFDATMQDPQFLAEAEKMDLPVSGPIGGPAAAKIIDDIYAAPAGLIARAQEVVGR
jgi:hypothetical protein